MRKSHSDSLPKRNKIFRRLLRIIFVGFVLMNIVAFIHAYKFTHFANNENAKTQRPEQLNFAQKLSALFLGVNNPRPKNIATPSGNYETIILNSNEQIEGWFIRLSIADSAEGTVVLCHGYGGEKSSMLDKAAIFDSLGYNTFLIDFMGSGGSEGNTTTIGFKEADQVKSAYEYVKQKTGGDIILFGTSMGAAAIMKAIDKHKLEPKAVIIECPFGTMYETVKARFDNMGVPAFPMANLLVFWGGVQNGFWAFGHNPAEYAKSLKMPTLIMWGEKDKNVSRKETEDVFNNVPGEKILKVYPLAGHENYLVKYNTEWTNDVASFLNKQ